MENQNLGGNFGNKYMKNPYASGSKSKGTTFKQAYREFKRNFYKKGTHIAPFFLMDDPERTLSKRMEDLLKD